MKNMIQKMPLLIVIASFGLYIPTYGLSFSSLEHEAQTIGKLEKTAAQLEHAAEEAKNLAETAKKVSKLEKLGAGFKNAFSKIDFEKINKLAETAGNVANAAAGITGAAVTAKENLDKLRGKKSDKEEAATAPEQDFEIAS